jgi:hypothetical protein
MADSKAAKALKKVNKPKASSAGKEAKANARALKAANKPTNKTGSAADRKDRATLQGQKNLIKNADPARANRTRGGSVRSMKEYGGLGLTNVKLTPKQAARQKEISKELNPVRKEKPKNVKVRAKLRGGMGRGGMGGGGLNISDLNR